MAGLASGAGKAVGGVIKALAGGGSSSKGTKKMASAKMPPGIKNSAKNRAAVNKSNKALGLKGKAASANRASTGKNAGKKLAGNTAKQKSARAKATGAAKGRVSKLAPKAAAARKGGSGAARRTSAKRLAKGARVSGSGKGGAG